LSILPEIAIGPGRIVLAGAPQGVDALALNELARQSAPVLHIARDDAHMARIDELVRFFGPDLYVLKFPAWDCLPYDRVSPARHIQSQRAATLARLARKGSGEHGMVVLSTVSAALQRVPPREFFGGGSFLIERGKSLSQGDLFSFLAANGFNRTETVREPGEYAVRGGIIDLFPSDTAEPLRIDLFGDTVETIRRFDAATQRTVGPAERVELWPVGEYTLDEAARSRFRSEYRALFGAAAVNDPIYEAVTAGYPIAGIEHWLPLFHEQLVTLVDYMPDAIVTLDQQADDAVAARLDQIADYYARRQDLVGTAEAGGIYRPVPPERLFLDDDTWRAMLDERRIGVFSPFPAPEGQAGTINLGGRRSFDFAEARARPEVNVYDAVHERLTALRTEGRRPIVAAYTEGSRERLMKVFGEHGITDVDPVMSWQDMERTPLSRLPMIVLGLDRGFALDGVEVITEPDILGERIGRPEQRRRRAEDFLTELSSLEAGDLVVHVDHGIGRYEGLETIEAAGAPHDCLKLTYDGGDRLFVPVENMDVLSRYGSEESGAQLDKLGGAGWQARKARVKERIREIADELLKIAAERELRPGFKIAQSDGTYDEFAARFPYLETDDQTHAIKDVFGDLAVGRPMDRLICGDVGFGKTEVALRAAFMAVMAGYQVAVVVPTTLLARQHHRTFVERFRGFPVRIGQLSRLVGHKDAEATKRELTEGTLDVVIGTHALLGASISFKHLGLLIVDEEQHFGVKQKERLKALRHDVHVLTLTATPIPRTLQMALSGVREMSLIATPPVDRLAVRTFVLPYDPVIIREAIEREVFRGGQVYYVCPRIADLAHVEERLRKLVPEMKIGVAHGRMAATALEDVMTAFYDGAFQILLSTNIIESGLDIPSVNTIIIHRADMFGLAQLYQLRGRVGRAKTRAYAYLTIPNDMRIGVTAEKRLEVMQTLDSLGAGFSLASYDLDIRGAGNLLGEEQSGHIREVGIELYQQMLEEAVAAARDRVRADHGEPATWSPHIAIGMPVLIPESYVPDLSVRLGLYRRIANLVDREEIEAFAAELIDRFGKLPEAVENLLEIVAIKRLCLAAGVEKLDAGPKGAVLSFYRNEFSHPEKLVRWLSEQAGTVSLRPDHKLVYRRSWDDAASRVRGVVHLMRQLADIAA
jgi:transcription-repair coupling factor (superfamily II helicase)